MNTIPCPICGRLSDTQIDGLCQDCFLKTVTPASIPQVMHITICPVCGALKRGGQWIDLDTEIEKLVEIEIKRALDCNPIAKNVRISISLTSSNPNIFHGLIRISAIIKGVTAQEDFETEVRIMWNICEICSRKAGGYYEALVQIRAQGRFPDEEEQEQLVDLVYEVVDRQYNTGNRKAFITKIEALHEGKDIYLGSNNTAQQICRTAVERFGCKFRKSPTLVGRKKGNDIYRITYSLRLPRFVPGDIIDFSGKPVLIRHSGKRTSGLYLESGLEFLENTDRLSNAKKVADVGSALSTVLISVEGNTVQVMHPEKYNALTIIRPAYISGTGGKDVRIITIGDSVYILPPE